MKKTINSSSKKENISVPIGADFFERLWAESWTYIKTVVDVVREPIVILDKDLRVMVANGPFYKTFMVSPQETEGKVIYDLGNGQWDIPALKKLLEDVLPKSTFFKGFEVSHEFPVIGHKVMILNARQIHSKSTGTGKTPEPFPPIILLAIEDITEMMTVARKLSERTNAFESKMEERAKKSEAQIQKLEQEIAKLKKK